MQNLEQNKQTVIRFLTDALPHNDIEFVRQVVDKEAVTHRAGFAALYAATGDAIPKKGKFLDWMEQGWAVLHNALSDQKVEIDTIVAEGNKVMVMFHYDVLHNDTFVGVEGTKKRVQWDEVGIFHFNDEGKITDMWYLCEEMRLATEIGLKLTH